MVIMHTHTHTVVYSLPFQMSVYVFFLTYLKSQIIIHCFGCCLFFITSPCEQNEAGQTSIFIV